MSHNSLVVELEWEPGSLYIVEVEIQNQKYKLRGMHTTCQVAKILMCQDRNIVALSMQQAQHARLLGSQAQGGVLSSKG